jgi:hypothetical protein
MEPTNIRRVFLLVMVSVFLFACSKEASPVDSTTTTTANPKVVSQQKRDFYASSLTPECYEAVNTAYSTYKESIINGIGFKVTDGKVDVLSDAFMKGYQPTVETVVGSCGQTNEQAFEFLLFQMNEMANQRKTPLASTDHLVVKSYCDEMITNQIPLSDFSLFICEEADQEANETTSRFNSGG